MPRHQTAPTPDPLARLALDELRRLRRHLHTHPSPGLYDVRRASWDAPMRLALVTACRESDFTWEQIGRALGYTRQASRLHYLAGLERLEHVQAAVRAAWEA